MTETTATLQEVKDTFQKWLHLDGDLDVIDVVMAASIDRRVPGDPLWLLLISPSGGTKTEIVRANTTKYAYTLDSLTSHTLISGKIERDKQGNLLPVKGILSQIDGKVLIIKDLTVILGTRQEERDAIFSQLRSIYDGYIECGFGTSDKPIRVSARIGLIAAVTPAVDHYTKMYNQLGERFLKIRHNPDSEKATEKAMANMGKEEQMRQELSDAVSRFLNYLEVPKIEPVSAAFLKQIQRLAQATAILRTPVTINFWKYEVNSALTPSVEYPTRLSKQLLKLAYCLAAVRGKTTVTEVEIQTVQRVARDTAYPNRIRIIVAMENLGNQVPTLGGMKGTISSQGTQYTTREIAGAADIPLSTCWRELKELEYLNVVQYERVEEISNSYTGSTKHSPEKDGWILKNQSLRVLVTPFSVSKNTSGCSSFLEGGLDKGKIEKKNNVVEEREGAQDPLVFSETEKEEEYLPLVLCETGKAGYPLGFNETGKEPSSELKEREEISMKGRINHE